MTVMFALNEEEISTIINALEDKKSDAYSESTVEQYNKLIAYFESKLPKKKEG